MRQGSQAAARFLALIGLGASALTASLAPRSEAEPASTFPGTEQTAAEPMGVQRPLLRLSRADAWFGVATLVGVSAAAFADHELRERALAMDGEGARNLARAAEPLGRPGVLGSAILVGYLAGRTLDRPALAAASARIGLSVAVAAVATGGLKLAIGRVRPESSAAESDSYQPFSGHASFPSGHSSLAFATATALDRETDARWVPWVAYPTAALVGWSRVRDDKHWASDVVAGAALGSWTSAKTHDALRKRANRAGRLGLRIERGSGTVRATVGLAF